VVDGGSAIAKPAVDRTTVGRAFGLGRIPGFG